jgi:hypothetical protein
MPDDGQEQNRSDQPETLAGMLCLHLDKTDFRQLEEYRIEFEAVYGPTNLTKRYTSTWPKAQQAWLIEHDTKAYFDGLPPFYKAYLRGKMELHARGGTLDDMPDSLLRLFVTKGMVLDHEKRHR